MNKLKASDELFEGELFKAMELTKNILSESSTIYMKKRLKLFHEYKSFLVKKFRLYPAKSITSVQFFDTVHLKSFIASHQDVQKHLILTHCGQLFKSISLHKVSNLETIVQNPSFSLKDIPAFGTQFCKRSKRSSSDYYQVQFSDIVSVIKEHVYFQHSQVSLKSSHSCRMLVQCLTGLRPAATFRFKQHSHILPKRCQQCVGSRLPCDIPLSNCFTRLVVTKTKTNINHDMPLLPFILPCYQMLLKIDYTEKDYKVFMTSYNLYLKSKFSTRAHLCRKFLSNYVGSTSSVHNTGNWSSMQTLQRFYMVSDTKYISLFQDILNSL